MLIPKRSAGPRSGGLFRSPFREEGSEPPAVRYRRSREALYGKLAYVIVMAALIAATIALALSLWTLFRRHGSGLDPVFTRGTLAVVAVLVLLMGRRLQRHLRELLDLRRAVRRLKEEMDQPPPPA